VSFGSIVDWTQGIKHARETLFHLPASPAQQLRFNQRILSLTLVRMLFFYYFLFIYLFILVALEFELGFTFARQAPFHMNHMFSPSYSGYFGDSSWFFAWAGLDRNPILTFPPLLVWQTPCSAFFHWEWVLQTTFFFVLASLDFYPPDLSLSSRLEWQAHGIMSSCWLRWSLTSFLSRLVLNCDPSNLSLLSS
jgi:hypothetical protein